MIRISVDEALLQIKYVVEILKKPGSVALVPTETVYGLVARATDSIAVERIYSLKHRPEKKVMGWFAADLSDLEKNGVVLDGLPRELAEAYTPGPITIIAPTETGGTLGFRIPDSPFLLKILQEIGEPLVQTSANLSGRPDVLSVNAAIDELDGEPDLLVDGGNLLPGATGSTVVLATGKKGKILRQGTLNIAAKYLE